MTVLSAGREAIRDLAILDTINAPTGEERTVKARALVELDRRLKIEQAAEAGYMPSTVEGCIAVLHVAATIAETLAG